jgi:hypothetical protein
VWSLLKMPMLLLRLAERHRMKAHERHIDLNTLALRKCPVLAVMSEGLSIHCQC